MEIATVLINQNFDVGFPDLENLGRADISFQQGAANGLIECKALSADAGRKIHRKHFYRFMDVISQEVLDRMSRSGVSELVLITLKDRLPSQPPERHTFGSSYEESSSFRRDFACRRHRFRDRAQTLFDAVRCVKADVGARLLR